VHLQTFLSIPITQKCQTLSYDALVANERYIAVFYAQKLRGNKRVARKRKASGFCTGRVIRILSMSLSIRVDGFRSFNRPFQKKSA